MNDTPADLAGTLRSGRRFRLTATALEIYDEGGATQAFTFPVIAGAQLDGSQLVLRLTNGERWPLLLNSPTDAATLGAQLAAAAGFTLERRVAQPLYTPYVPPPDRDVARLLLPLLSLVCVTAVIIGVLAHLGPLGTGLAALLALLFVPALVLAALTAWVARQKGRAVGEGFVLGFLFLVVGLIVELFLPARAYDRQQ